MTRWLARRIAQALAVVLVGATASFLLLHLAPGEPLAVEDFRMTPALRAAMRAQWGLDRPLLEQYVRWIANLARGDLGWSFSRQMPVRAVLADVVPRTLLLMGLALLVSLLAGIAIGVWQAVRPRSRAARAVGAVSLALYSIPDFLLAILVLLAFAHWLPILPAGGVVDPVMYDYMGPWARVVDRLRHLVLPVATLALLSTARISRFQRAALLEVVQLDYVRTARAKGLPERAVLLRHALRNALVPVVTLVGLALPSLLGGAVFVESVFSWPGMGYTVVGAIGTRDYALVTTCATLGAALAAGGALLADLLLALVDPRVRVPT